MHADVREAHFLGVNRRTLCLLGVGTSAACSRSRVHPRNFRQRTQLECCCIAAPENRANRCIAVLPVCRRENETFRIGDHRQVDRRDRSAIAGIRHMAGGARLFLNGEMFISKFISFPSTSTALYPLP